MSDVMFDVRLTDDKAHLVITLSGEQGRAQVALNREETFKLVCTLNACVGVMRDNGKAGGV